MVKKSLFKKEIEKENERLARAFRKALQETMPDTWKKSKK